MSSLRERWLRYRRYGLEPLPANASAAEREQRVLDIQRLAKRRRRTIALRSAIASAAIVLLMLVALYWIAMTVAGRDFLLEQVKLRLPEGTSLYYSSAEGPVMGPLTLHDVVFEHHVCPDEEGQPVAYPNCQTPGVIRFAAKRVMAHTAFWPLLGRTLSLRALEVDNAQLDLPKSDDNEPFELPRWPESLPDIQLPLNLRADTVQVNGLQINQDNTSVIAIRQLHGQLDARNGLLSVRDVMVISDRGRFSLHGDYAPGNAYQMNLTATAVLPARAGRTPAYFGLVARGDVSDLAVALVGHAPEPVRLRLDLQGRDTPKWALNAVAEGIDIGLLTDPQASASAEHLQAQLSMHGSGGAAQLDGYIKQGAFEVTIQPSSLTVAEQQLHVENLLVDVFGGQLQLQGVGDFREPENASYDFHLKARDLRWGQADAAIVAQADLQLQGLRTDWNVQGQSKLQRNQLHAELTLQAKGNAETMQLQRLQAVMPTGRLDATGTVDWAPALAWNVDARLAGFDPGYFVPQFAGAVSGVIHSKGGNDADGVLAADVTVNQLGGQLRGRALAGQAQLTIKGSQYQGKAQLNIGQSRVQAQALLADAINIQAAFSPLQLNDLLPDAQGVVQGNVHLTGTFSAPNIEADLNAQQVRYGDYQAEHLRVQGKLPWSGAHGQLQLQASQLQAGLALQSLQLNAQGTLTALTVDANASAESGRLAVQGRVQQQGNGWAGEIAQLQLNPAVGASWSLNAPAQFRQQGAQFYLSQSCFTAQGGGRLCANADWPRQGVDVQGEGLPLDLLHGYLPTLEDDMAMRIRGALDVQAQLRAAGNAWNGTAQVRAAEVDVRTQASRYDLLRLRQLQLDADFDPQRIEATLSTRLLGADQQDGGRLQAQVRTGWDSYAPLDGQVDMDITELTWLELFSPDIVDPKGRISGQVRVAGTLQQPQLGGAAQLTGFAAEVPALALQLTEGQLQLRAQPDGSAQISGRLRSGQGYANISGGLNWQTEGTPLQLNVRGQHITAADTRDIQAVVSPNVQVRYKAGEPLIVSGNVSVESATMDLEGLSKGVGRSADVVVLDPVDPEQTAASDLVLDLLLVMGDDVHLRGFGFDGDLNGRLRVRAQPGREMTGEGRLDIGGRYHAYGQDLTVTRGGLLWSNTPISDPILDVRAEREIGEVIAGINVSGRVSQMEAEVWSNQGGSQTDALSYLTLGRPMSGLTGDEAKQVSAASTALTAGGSLLASQLGAHIGLDDAGIMQSRTAGSIFGVGRYLSPKLYVGYGVSMLGTGQVLMLKYMLRHGFDMQMETGSLETRGSFNWRHERGGPKVQRSSDIDVQDDAQDDAQDNAPAEPDSAANAPAHDMAQPVSAPKHEDQTR